MNKKIGIFDSGIGGKSVLKEVRKFLPNEDYIYYADTKNNPYGEKSEEELLNITADIVQFLIKKNCKIIVIACNTATCKCMKKLRKMFPNMIFVGTVPAIKVACDAKCKKTLVLATPVTIKSERTHELVTNNKNKDQEITLLPCKGLAEAIENSDDKKIDKILDDILKADDTSSFDSIVLGCTHYSLIREKIAKRWPKAKIYDGSFGVAKQVKSQLEEANLLSDKKTKGKLVTYNSKTLGK